MDAFKKMVIRETKRKIYFFTKKIMKNVNYRVKGRRESFMRDRKVNDVIINIITTFSFLLYLVICPD
jgi:hypothetical protein